MRKRITFLKRKRTTFLIKINKDIVSNVRFLSNIRGFDYGDSYYGNTPDLEGNVMCEAIYNRRLSCGEEKEIEVSINKVGGNIINVLHFAKDPILSKETSNMLINCSIISGVSFLPGQIGVPLLAPSKIIEGFAIGGITALLTFLIEIYIERKIRLATEEEKTTNDVF